MDINGVGKWNRTSRKHVLCSIGGYCQVKPLRIFVAVEISAARLPGVLLEGLEGLEGHMR